jgi:hypothetical protein
MIYAPPMKSGPHFRKFGTYTASSTQVPVNNTTSNVDLVNSIIWLGCSRQYGIIFLIPLEKSTRKISGMKGHCAIRENEPRFTHLAAAGPHNPKYKTTVNAPTYEATIPIDAAKSNPIMQRANRATWIN